MIPRTLHFVWLNPPIPDWILRNVEEFRKLNPGWEIRWHGRGSLLPELQSAYDSCKAWCSKADLVFLSVLLREGGWYLDCDFWPLWPMDRIVDVWGVDGRRTFVAAQNNVPAPISNAIVACEAGAAGLQEIVSAASTRISRGRCTFGPELFTEIVNQKPGLFTVAPWPWFYPVYRDTRTGEPTLGCYRRALAGSVSGMRRVNQKTGGQMPCMFHLWADALSPMLARAFKEPVKPERPFVLLEQFPEGRTMNRLAEGFRGLGLDVRRYRCDDESVLERGPDLPICLVGWNNVRRRVLHASAVRLGVPSLWSEHGFFRRDQYVQIDPEGFLHRASWHRTIAGPAPDDGAAKLARFYPKLAPMRRLPSGYILVVGQVAGDTQMADSELQGPLPLQRQVARALPQGATAYFRPHPQTGSGVRSRCHVHLPLLSENQDERAAYRDTKSGPGLAAALSGASFVLTINSNAAVEALAAGVPVLAFGPHLGIDAGVIRRCTVETLAADIKAMLDGWRPEQARVENFLRWLAARQWNGEELADPEVARRLLADAGVVFDGGGVGSGSLPGPGLPATVSVTPEGIPEEQGVMP